MSDLGQFGKGGVWLCESQNTGNKYMNGSVDLVIENQNIRLRLKFKIFKTKNKLGPKSPDYNIFINDWVVLSTENMQPKQTEQKLKPTPAPTKPKAEYDDNVPF